MKGIRMNYKKKVEALEPNCFLIEDDKQAANSILAMCPFCVIDGSTMKNLQTFLQKPNRHVLMSELEYDEQSQVLEFMIGNWSANSKEAYKTAAEYIDFWMLRKLSE